MYLCRTIGPTKADIKLIIQDTIFGMGSFNADKPKTLCLIGPHNSGKNLLCKIIASEIGKYFYINDGLDPIDSLFSTNICRIYIERNPFIQSMIFVIGLMKFVFKN